MKSIIITGMQMSAHDNLNTEESLKDIYGNISLDFTSSGDMQEFVNADGKLDRGAFYKALYEKLGYLLSSKIEL